MRDAEPCRLGIASEQSVERRLHRRCPNGKQKAGICAQHVQANNGAIGVEEWASRRSARKRRGVFEALEQMAGTPTQGERLCRHAALRDPQPGARVARREYDIPELRHTVRPGDGCDLARWSRDKRDPDDAVRPLDRAFDNLARNPQLDAGSGQRIRHGDESILAHDQAGTAPGAPAQRSDSAPHLCFQASDLQHASIITNVRYAARR